MKEQIREYLKSSPKLLNILKKVRSNFHQLNAKRHWKKLEQLNNVKIELGSGPKNGKNGWTTVDLYGADINWDLRKGIPLPEQSVDNLYCSHLLEHIPFHQLMPFLRECRRVLKNEGEFSVCVPNFRYWIDAYIQGQLFRERDLWWTPGKIDTGSSIDQINYVAYMLDEHKYMFDEENLLNTFLKAGYSNVKLRQFDSQVDLPERDYGSIYAIAAR